MDSKSQLTIKRQGKILIFKDNLSGRRWYAQKEWIWSLLYGSRKFYYASAHTPAPVGRPKKISLI